MRRCLIRYRLRWGVVAAILLSLSHAVQAQSYSRTRSRPAAVETTVFHAKADTQVAAEQPVRNALARTKAFGFVDAPLSGVADALTAQLGIEVRLDTKGLQEAAIDGGTPITHSAGPMRVGPALDLLLEPLDLTHVIRGNVLWITTKTHADAMTETRVYPVFDLAHSEIDSREIQALYGYLPSSGRYSMMDFDPLIELITSTVRPTSWEAAGGPGNVKGFEHSGALVVSNTQRVHEEVQYLLANLRRTRNWQRIPLPEAADRISNDTPDEPAESPGPSRRSPRPTAGRSAAWQVPRSHQ